MPKKDFIMRTLNLEEINVERLEYIYKYKRNYYLLTLVSRGRFCPECGCFTNKIHGYKDKQIRHSILFKEELIVIYHQRRYICTYCNKTFVEYNPFVGQGNRTTSSTKDNVLKALKDYNATFSSVARSLSLSPTEVINIFDQYVQIERKQLQEVICIDEIYFSPKSKNKYICLLVGFKNGLILDVLESRKKAYLIHYFRSVPIQERQTVRFISMDMYENYRCVARLLFPEAIVCADSFHVVKNINDALNKIRCKIMRRYKENKKSDEYYLLKNHYKLLFIDSLKINDDVYKYNHHYKYKLSDSLLLEKMLSIDKELKSAYELKELYSIFNSSYGDINQKKIELEKIIAEYKTSSIPLFVKLGFTLEDWKNEIINSFYTYNERRINNGPIEGRNKYIGIIINLANGYTNFKRFRNRVLYVFNKFEKSSDNPLDIKNIRNIGKLRGKYKK